MPPSSPAPLPGSSSPPPRGPASTLARQALLGLLIATVLVLLLLFSGSEDRGFIYIDF